MKIRTGILIILDGFGVNKDPKANAVLQAKMPNFRKVDEKYPHTEISASEREVGLPKGFMGNSEVGHLNIGAGRIVFQDFSLISKSIDDESFFQNSALTGVCRSVKSNKASLHLMGLVSDGGVHSHVSHLYALLQLAKREGVESVWIHVFTDGRDTSPTSGKDFVKELVSYCKDVGVGKIASVSGRFYAMDRDNRWERIQLAYDAITEAVSNESFSDPVQYIDANYNERLTDEFLKPAVAKGYPGMQDRDGVIFFNFRADRARELTRAITEGEFHHFKRKGIPALSGFVMMTPYDDTLKLPAAFQKPKVVHTLGEIISDLGWKQLRIAETEKYAHVTYFFNGGDEHVFPGEKRVLVPSPREVKTYDQKPEMSARKVTEDLLKELKETQYGFVVVNFANPDMVGHTGNLKKAIEALEVVDECLGKIFDWVESHGAFAILTADHGNCEQMEDDDGTPLTSHTLLPVPFCLIDPLHKNTELSSGGRLCDIAPTMLAVWGITQPGEMTGRSLIKN